MSLPQQFMVNMRDYVNDHWSPSWTGTPTLPNGSKGTLCIREFSITAGHLISIPFVVHAGQGQSSFKCVNEVDHGTSTNQVHASISTGAADHGRLAEYSGRQTGTDQPFGHYQDKIKMSGTNTGNNRSVLELDPGTYWLNLWSDNSTSPMRVPLGRSEN